MRTIVALDEQQAYDRGLHAEVDRPNPYLPGGRLHAAWHQGYCEARSIAGQAF